MLTRIFISISLVIFISACASTGSKKNTESPEFYMYQFARANCMYWYLESKSIDAREIERLSGEIIRQSEIPVDEFMKIAMFVRDYIPIDPPASQNPKLYRCFTLEKAEALTEIIASYKNKK